MDAGIDRAVVKFFGEGVMHAVQKKILEDYLGKQTGRHMSSDPHPLRSPSIHRTHPNDARTHEH